jgi:hypothetical protein
MAVNPNKLLQETGDDLWQETGDHILLDDAPDAPNNIIAPVPRFAPGIGSQAFTLFYPDSTGSGVIGSTLTYEVSKNNEAFVAGTGTFTEINYGFYVLTCSEADVNQSRGGPLTFRITDGTNPTLIIFGEVSVNPADWRTQFLHIRTLARERR